MAGPHAHVYAPREGHRLRHDPFNSIVAPRPIGWVSTVSGDGAVNLAPYSFFNAFNYTPPIIGFCSIGWKDSVRNAAQTRQFCWNLVTAALGPQMNLTCAPAPPEIDEFDVAGLTRAPSRLVAPPRVLESPVNFECEVTQIVQLAGADGRSVPSWLVLGEVVMAHIDQAVLDDGVFDTLAAHPIMRGGGLGDYFGVSAPDRFQMRRPGWPTGA